MSVFNFSTSFQNDQKYSVGLNERTGNQSFPKAQIAQAVFQQAPIKHRIAIYCREAIVHTVECQIHFYSFLGFFFPNEKHLGHE